MRRHAHPAVCLPWDDMADVAAPIPARTTASTCRRCYGVVSRYNPSLLCHVCQRKEPAKASASVCPDCRGGKAPDFDYCYECRRKRARKAPTDAATQQRRDALKSANALRLRRAAAKAIMAAMTRPTAAGAFAALLAQAPQWALGWRVYDAVGALPGMGPANCASACKGLVEHYTTIGEMSEEARHALGSRIAAWGVATPCSL